MRTCHWRYSITLCCGGFSIFCSPESIYICELQLYYMNYYLYSSTVFFTNSVNALLYGEYLYSGLFTYLVGTSLLYHSYPSIYTNLLDKTAIACVILHRWTFELEQTSTRFVLFTWFIGNVSLETSSRTPEGVPL